MADGKENFDKQRKESQDGFSVIFQNLKRKFDLTSPIDKQKILNILFGLILNISNMPMQEHYIQTLGEKLGIGYEVMRAQYVQFAKNEGRFILQQSAKKTEKRYQIDRESLVAALFYQEFIKQFIESQEKRTQLLELIDKITITLPDTAITIANNDIEQKETMIELQLRWDKELNDGKEEEKRYQIIKQIILPIIKGYVQRITKDNSISSESKQDILNLMKKM
ncbi:MAG: hypothetical protein WCJ45_03240 [bacterium]